MNEEPDLIRQAKRDKLIWVLVGLMALLLVSLWMWFDHLDFNAPWEAPLAGAGILISIVAIIKALYLMIKT